MISCIRLFNSLIVFHLIFTGILQAHEVSLPPGFAAVLVAQELDPTAMAISPDGRIFITEKSGRVRVVDNGQLLPDPFLVLEVDNYNERGLSGIAFDPSFEENGYLYLYYTVKGANHNRVSRFTADGNYVMAGSETILLDIDPLASTVHNAGSMSFGPDGKLYISIGDGANGNASQDMNSLLGKVIRINADGSIPEDNPFYNETTGIYRAIYALGLRNSFSMAFQPGTGRLFATEVGAASWEEINEILPGHNYGWPLIEGPINGQSPPDNYMEPVFSYNHNAGCAAVGTAFYNPEVSMFPPIYDGKFFFADYCRGYIKFMNPDIPGIASFFATGIDRPLNLLVAPDGTMYYLARAGIGGGSQEDNTASEEGTLWRIFYTGSGAPFISVNPQSLLVSEGEQAHFAISASGDEPLAYQWQKNGEDIPGTNTSEYIILSTTLPDSGSVYRCIVNNGSGTDTSATCILRVTSNTRPEPEIITPVAGSTYRAGDTLFFSGRALDNEQIELNGQSMRWKIDFHHNVHTHPGLVSTTGITEGEFMIPSVGETSDNVWYRIHLNATDQGGLNKSVTRDIYPVKTIFHVHTIPDSLPVYIESDYLTSPVSDTSVVGIIRQIGVLPSILDGDTIYVFREWSDGETQPTRSFPAADDTLTYTAMYEAIPIGDGTGLRAYYYDNPPYDPNYYPPYLLTRIDTIIDFNWGEASPDNALFGEDFWIVRWEGFVEPYFTDSIHFHVTGDDGVRLWVDNQLIANGWIAQAPTEYTGSIKLEAGVKYPVRLEFFEQGGGAVCRMAWSSNRMAKNIIPKSQLFPDNSTSTHEGYDEGGLILYPNPVQDILVVEMRDPSAGIREIQVLGPLGQVLMQKTIEVGQPLMQLDLRGLSNGMYWVKYIARQGQTVALPFFKL